MTEITKLPHRCLRIVTISTIVSRQDSGSKGLVNRLRFIDGGASGNRAVLASSLQAGAIPEIARVPVIVELYRKSHFASPYGAYNPEKPYDKNDTITKAKIKFTAGQLTNPAFAALASDWGQIMKNIEHIPHRDYKEGEEQPAKDNFKLPVRNNVELNLQHDLVVVSLTVFILLN